MITYFTYCLVFVGLPICHPSIIPPCGTDEGLGATQVVEESVIDCLYLILISQ